MNKYLIIAALAGVALLGSVLPINGTTVVEKLGAVSSPDILSPYFSVGGVRQWAGRTDSLSQATTTVCAIQSPAATSSLLYGSIKFSVGTTTNTIVHMAKAAGPTATTSSLGLFALASGAQGQGTASSTGNHIFSPNTWFVVGMQGGTGTFSPTGTCEAIWVEM